MKDEVSIMSKCQNCGSELWYNPKEKCLTCKYCESNYFLPKKKDDAVIVRQYSKDFHPNQLNRMLEAYRCNNCKSTYFMSYEGTSKKCPNCGGSSCTLVESDGYCADAIIPFKITKEEASKKFLEHISHKFGEKKKLKKFAINNNLMGVYVPVWNFSFNVSGTYGATATELRKDASGSYYSVAKPVFGEKFKRVKSLDKAASGIEDDGFLELFDETDYAELIPYSPEYTYGYRVDSIDKNIHEYYNKITKEAESILEDEMKKNVLSRFKEVRDIMVEAKAEDVFFNFAYVPVYVNTFTYKGKVYKTYISGTTGKTIGKVPRSIGKYVKIFLGVAAAALVAAAIYFFLK